MNILILGAGLMGRGALFDFQRTSGVESITIADGSKEALDRLKNDFTDSRIRYELFDAANENQVRKLMSDKDGVFCAVHYGFNEIFTKAAVAEKTNLVDLGGNNDVVRKQMDLTPNAKQAGISVFPDCGLAPGLVSILSAWGVNRFPWVDTVRIRVGGLPLDPNPPFYYERLFSVEGLINEYIEPPVLLKDGKIVVGEPLGDYEELQFDPPVGKLEAFNTSGGASTLPETYRKRLKNLDYKTLRYPGHVEAIRWMFHLDLFSSEPEVVDGVSIVPRKLASQKLVEHIPVCKKDRTVVRVDFTGADNGKEEYRRLEIIDEFDSASGLTSMMRMTAFPAAIVLQMQCDGRIPEKGVLKLEESVDPDVFLHELQNRGVKIKGL